MYLSVPTKSILTFLYVSAFVPGCHKHFKVADLFWLPFLRSAECLLFDHYWDVADVIWSWHLFLDGYMCCVWLLRCRPGPQMTFCITWAQKKEISVLLLGGWGILSPIADFSTSHKGAHIDALSPKGLPQLLLDLAVFSKASSSPG